MAAITICSDFGAPQNKVSHCFHCFPIYLPWSDGTRCHDLSFLNVELNPTFSFSSFTFIKRLFSFSSLSAISVVSSAYLRLLIFLPAILIPGQRFSWCTLRPFISPACKTGISLPSPSHRVRLQRKYLGIGTLTPNTKKHLEERTNGKDTITGGGDSRAHFPPGTQMSGRNTGQ